ncbi:YdaS family helix-turn-helix protein [Novosphingobium sp. FSW06-99]|uniref:transcriptional regulator n=1 Tax=Novosphingobium sp. FSW06-99 TaxID=1739113 RepID=UPI0009E86041|nr:YdaS family helix-turn-helix protein [Novosphingobium sp. FSW06-99]
MDDSDVMRIALEDAIKITGTQSEFARRRGVAQPTVHDWLKRMKRIPAEHVLATEADTGVSRHRLRPDIYPIENPPSSQPHGGAAEPGGSHAPETPGSDPAERLRA